MSKKVILVIIVIILLSVLGFILISKENKSKTYDGNLGRLKDNQNVYSNTNNQSEKMVYIEPGRISNFDKGYYYIDNNRNNIKYFDYSTKKEIYLCNKPNCKHDTEECSSYLDATKSNNLFVYDDFLYLISGMDEAETVKVSMAEEGTTISEVGGQTPIIYRMNLDGTNKTKLFECPSGIEISSNVIFEGNNLYTFFSKNKTIESSKNSYTSIETDRELVKISLETKKYEELLDSKNRKMIRSI